jgi:hypothetical protein
MASHRSRPHAGRRRVVAAALTTLGAFPLLPLVSIIAQVPGVAEWALRETMEWYLREWHDLIHCLGHETAARGVLEDAHPVAQALVDQTGHRVSRTCVQFCA